MPSSTIRRQMKNMVNNYSDAEKKVREATSNDPWGPSSSLMSEIADLTYNVVAFSEIMSMIWKRLNDHGKNWRHVYKALTLLDYLIKTGSERVALQCKENIFAIQTLKDFQYVDRDGKDQGINVREKSKQLVVLLKDEERLKGERSQALKTKERMAQVSTGSSQMGFGRGSSQPNLSTSYSEEYGRSDGSPASYHGSTSPNVGSELEQARPQTSGEEELQLQLALAMSREAAEQEERLRRGDDLRLQMALEESKKGGARFWEAEEEERAKVLFNGPDGRPRAWCQCGPLGVRGRIQGNSSTRRPLAVLRNAAALAGLHSCPACRGGASRRKDAPSGRGAGGVGPGPKPAAPVDPWGTTPSVPPLKSSDPWASDSAPAPWSSAAARPKTSTTGSFELFRASNGTSKEDFSEFDSLRSSSSVLAGDGGMASSGPSQASLANSSSLDLFDPLPTSLSMSTHPTRKTPESFLGPNAALVNLDSLVTKPAQPVAAVNPFLASTGGAAPATHANPFQVSQPAPPTLNQMRLSPMPAGFGAVAEPVSFPSVPGQPITMVPLAGMAPMGHAGPAMAAGAVGGATAGIPSSMPQPLMSIPPQAGAQPAGTTNPFLL
ncbi:epsin-2 [Takifugu rubripes]|nr:epsin-2-like [Takifugu rubripes]